MEPVVAQPDNSPITNLIRVVFPLAAMISVPPLALGWVLIQAAQYLN